MIKRVENNPSNIFLSLENVSSLLNNKKLIPNYFKAPLFVSVEITNNCQLNCIHCYNNSGKNKQELDIKQLLEISNFIKDMQVLSICITGGEALLHKYFWEFVYSLPKKKVLSKSLITNGWLLTPKTCKKISEEFSLVQISIDGILEQTHNNIRGHKESFTHAINALKELRNYPEVKKSIGFSAMKSNYLELPDLIEFAINNDVKFFEIIPLMLVGRAYKNSLEKKELLSDEELIDLHQTINKLQEIYKNKINIHYAANIEWIVNDLLSGKPNIYTQISADGSVKLLPQFSLTFGNIYEETLIEIWNQKLGTINNNEEVKNYLKTIQTFESINKQISIPYRSRLKKWCKKGIDKNVIVCFLER